MEELLTWPQRGRLWLRLAIRGTLTAAGLAVLVYGVIPLISFFMPFVLALAVAWVLDPLVGALHRRLPLSRGFLSLLVLLLVLAAVGFLCRWAGQLLIEQAQQLLGSPHTLTDTALQAAERVLPAPVGERLTRLAEGWLESWDISAAVKALAGRAADMAAAIPAFAVSAVVFLTAACFLTGDYPRLRWAAGKSLPNGLKRLKDICVHAFGGYLKSQLILSLGVFLLLAAGFMIVRQTYGLLLALALAVLDFIPLLGAGAVLVPWAVAELLGGSYRHAAELMSIWGVVVVFRRVAEPRVLGDRTGLSPILSLLAIYTGMKLGGIGGMILGPVTLLVVMDLAKQGVFRSAADDLRRAAADVAALLRLSG